MNIQNVNKKGKKEKEEEEKTKQKKHMYLYKMKKYCVLKGVNHHMYPFKHASSTYFLHKAPAPSNGCKTPVDDSPWTIKRTAGLC